MHSIYTNTEDLKAYSIPSDDDNLINLATNQNYIPHPPCVQKVIDNPPAINLYPTARSHRELTALVAEYVHVAPENILLTHGSGNALKLILSLAISGGSGVAMQWPNYPGFIHDIALASAKITRIKDDLSNLKNCIECSSIVYISSPNMPLGHTRDYEILMQASYYRNKVFLVDEAYKEYTNMPSAINTQTKNLLVTRTFSKAFAAAGIRLGYIVGHKDTIARLRVGVCPKDISEHTLLIGIAIMKSKKYYLDQVGVARMTWAGFIQKLDEFLHRGIPDVEYLITGYQIGKTMPPFFLLKTSDASSADYVVELFRKAGIIVRNKSADVGWGCVRVSLSTAEHMEKVMDNIQTINGRCRFDNIYLDIDGTIRQNCQSLIDDEIALMCRNHNVTFVTNNMSGEKTIRTALDTAGFTGYNLLTPFSQYSEEVRTGLGYIIQKDSVCVFKFPSMTYELIRAIETYKLVYVAELSDYEYGHELGMKKNLKIPYIGIFKKIIDKEVDGVRFVIVGKQSWILPEVLKRALMIGDSEMDYDFAKLNGMSFIKVNSVLQTHAALQANAALSRNAALESYT